MTSKTISIALPWHALGHSNLGIDALTRSNIAIIESACEDANVRAEFTTLCANTQPDPSTVPANVTIGPMPRPREILRGNSPFIAALRASDLVIDIGEGDSWTDIYGGKRFNFHAGTKIAALLLGKPLVLAPQTIGPFGNTIRRIVARTVMNRTKAVYARDGLSSDFLRQQAVSSETGEFIDVAFRLPFDVPPANGDAGKIGLNVSGLLYQGGYTGKNEFGLVLDYRALTHRLIEYWQAEGQEVHLIPHVIGRAGNDGDLAVVPDLVALYPDLVVPPTFASASAAKTYMAGLDFVTGGRMHACIGAFSARTPVVPIAYSRKFNGLFGTLRYPHFVDGKTMSTDEAFAKIVAAYDSRERLARDIDTGMTIAEQRLDAYQSALTRIIEEVVA